MNQQEQAREATETVSEMMDIPPMPLPTKRVGIYIDIDNDNIEQSVANCIGSVTELGEALILTASFNDKMLMPIFIAAAALTADKPELRKKYDDLVAYFDSTPQHG